LDKLFELLANFTFLMSGLLVIAGGGLFGEIPRPTALVGASLLFILPPLYLLALRAGRSPFTGLVRAITRLFPRELHGERMITWASASESEISILVRRKPVAIALILLVSGGLWLHANAEYWLSVRFLGPALNLSQAVSALTFARLAFLPPLPAGIGALEASQAMAMQALGFGAALGISLSLLIRARDVSLGLLGLWWGARLGSGQQISVKPTRVSDMINYSKEKLV
jgi:uncharacterized membrane protein YbhN (UPF0104 family)